jgi:hypothetical protein
MKQMNKLPVEISTDVPSICVSNYNKSEDPFICLSLNVHGVTECERGLKRKLQGIGNLS